MPFAERLGLGTCLQMRIAGMLGMCWHRWMAFGAIIISSFIFLTNTDTPIHSCMDTCPYTCPHMPMRMHGHLAVVRDLLAEGLCQHRESVRCRVRRGGEDGARWLCDVDAFVRLDGRRIRWLAGEP